MGGAISAGWDTDNRADTEEDEDRRGIQLVVSSRCVQPHASRGKLEFSIQ